MKTKVKRLSKRTLAMFLGVLMLVTSLGLGSLITVNAWGVKGGHRIYFVNTNAWTSVYQHFWGSSWHTHEQMDNISGTGIYTKWYDSDYTGDGFNFMNSSTATSGGTNAFTDWVTGDKVYWPNSASDSISSTINGTAKVTTMIDTGTGSYTEQANSDCVATISSINIPSGWSDTQPTSGSTGSYATAECYPAYGASVKYSASDGSEYEFKGFSTTNSTSLPSNATTSFNNRTSVGYNGSNNLSTVYAYFQKKSDDDSDKWEDTTYKLLHSSNNDFSSAATYTVKKNTTQGYYAVVVPTSSLSLNTNYYAAISDSTDKTKIWNHNSGDSVEVVSNTTSPFGSTGSQSHYLGTSTNYTFSRYSLQAKPGDGYISIKIWHTDGGTKLHYQFYSGDITATQQEEDLSISFYAKDGVVRDGNDCTSMFGTTTVTAKTGEVTVNGTRSTVNNNSARSWQTGTATKGKSITVSTKVSSTYADKYYVVGYSYNGYTPNILTPYGETGSTATRDASGNVTYTDTWTIPDEYTYTKLEITPIYFLKDSDNAITFYIDGYDAQVQNSGWGDTLYIYPFYAVSGSTDPKGQAKNFRAYPGQPVVNNGGRRYTQIPLDDKGDGTGVRVKGVTINNGYWDSVHGTSYSGGANFVSAHHQTYDYDDFYKIYKKNQTTINSIKFTFKYETTSQNREMLPRKSGNNYYAGTGTTAITDNTYLNYNNYSSEKTTSAMEALGNGWESYVDGHNRKVDLFGTVLTNTQINANKPLKVISTGYQWNNAGAFGTEWIVYYYDTSSSKYKKVAVSGGRSSIVPSALVLSSDNNYEDFSASGNFAALDSDLGVSDYLDIYKALEAYRNYPVEITYEKDLLGGVKRTSGYNEYDEAYRCDGRWTFTKKTDYVSANMKIEYVNGNDVKSWAQDTQDSATGEGANTKNKAYFTDGDAENKIKTGNVVISDTEYFNFTAETYGNYEFVGWGLENADGDISSYEPMNDTSLKGKTLRASTVTVVARFQYVTEGTLLISHNLASNSKGLGTTYIGVKVNDGTKDYVLADVATNSDDVKIPKTYVKSKNSSYTVTVTLKTVPIGENAFSSFSANKTTAAGVTASVSSGQTFFNGTTSSGTRTITFTIGNLFSDTTQTYTSLEYLSTLTESVNKYVINYKYNSRLYGEKTFTKKGTFTATELSSYLDSGTGTDKKFKASLITAKAPAESNFNEDFSWNTAKAISSGTSGTKSGTTYTFTINVESVQTANTKRTGTFYVPYDFSVEAADKYYPTDVDTSNGYTLVEKTDEQHFDIATTYKGYFETGATDSKYKSEHGDNQTFVIAPNAVKDGNDIKFFSYWKIETSDGKREIAKCFYNEFNYRAYDNYKITAVYDAATQNEFLDNYNKNVNSTTISFLGDSRNQWNDGTTGGAGYNSADLIFNDFAVAFNYGDKLISESGADVSVGIVVQRVQEIEKDSTGAHGTSLETYEKNNEGTVSAAIDNVKKLAAGTTVSGFTAFRQTIDKSQVNNKNRTEQYIGLYNGYSTTKETETLTSTNLKDYVYRAFSYIKIGSNVYVSEKPAYFCMYNTAIA